MPDLVVPKLHQRSTAPMGSRARSDYAELEVTTNFSFLRGASHPDELMYRAAELGYRAIAITDFTTLAGVVRAYEAWKEAESKGIAPRLIIGARLTLNDFPDLLVWPTDRPAYARLCRLLTLGKRRAEKGSCILTLDDFLAHQEGMLAAIANRHEHPFRHPAVELAHGSCPKTLENLARLREVMGDRLSLAICRLYGENDSRQVEAAIEISRRFATPLLATNAVYYHDPSRRQLQDMLTCIRHALPIQQAGYRLFPNGERYLKTPEMMRRLFIDLPRAIHRGLEIAERCTFSLSELRYEYPRELAPEGKTQIEYLRDLVYEGAAERYGQERHEGTEARRHGGSGGDQGKERVVEQRREGTAENSVLRASVLSCLRASLPSKILDLLNHELQLIEQLHYEAYFLTVYDVVKFARSRGILCQGRGSAANSAVCFCLGITNVDPARVDVLFERFISAARGEPPDIDVDFEHERREEVLQYLYDKYGRERAGMTAEVITYRGRSAVRDVGKALGLSVDMVDQMARHLEGWSAGTISDDQLREIGMDPANPHIRQVIDITAQLLGFPRHLSQHVGGMVMTQTPLCEMVPIENASMEDRTVIEWDKNDIDTVGILKVDCLGLGMLTCLSKALSLINIGTKARRHEGTEEKENRKAAQSGGAETDTGTKGKRNGNNEESQGPDSVAIGDAAREGPVLLESQDASGGEVRPDAADETIRDLGPLQHSGGIRTTEHSGLHSVPEASERITTGDVNASGTGGVVGDEHDLTGTDRASEGRGQSSSGPDPEPAPQAPGGLTGSSSPSTPSCLRASVPSCLELSSSPSCLRASVPSCLELWSIPPEDPAVYDMICKADTIGVFQIESRAQMSMLPRLKPRNFYDLVIEVAIVRPGPIQGNMVHPYLRRRNGDDPVSYPSEALREVLSKTLGVPLFQEQAMKVAMVGAGFAADEADQLRRAMAAWRRHGAIERFYQRFIDGMIANGYTSEFAEQCFMQIRGFGEYGFPESHAASFALLVYASAWIKHYYPAEFACALINSQPMGFYAPAQIVRDAKAHGVEVREADVNRSAWDCLIEGRHEGTEARRHGGEVALRLGFRLIKGFPKASADAIVAARERLGRFESVAQLHRESGIRRKQMKTLAEADAFTSLGLSRRDALWQVMELSDEYYPLFDSSPSCLRASVPSCLPEMPIGQEVLSDYATTGMSLKKHPLAIIRPQLDEMHIIPTCRLSELQHETWVKVAGLVLIRQRPGTASGIVFETIEDETGIANIIVRPDVYDRHRAAARHARLLEVDGYIERSGDVIHIMAKRLIDLGHLMSELEHLSRDFH